MRCKLCLAQNEDISLKDIFTVSKKKKYFFLDEVSTTNEKAQFLTEEIYNEFTLERHSNCTLSHKFLTVINFLHTLKKKC